MRAPLTSSTLELFFGLMRWACRRENCELNSILGQDLKGFDVHGGLGQPHSFWLSSEPAFKIPDAPPDLRHFVAAIGEGEDHVVITLRHRGPMSRKSLGALF